MVTGVVMMCRSW